MNFKYNPGFSSDEDLIGAFVVRQKELQQILQTLQENTGRTYQHLLLVGARGTGKTMLVRRVAAEVRRSTELNQNWYPLVFGEESYRILSAGEFWLEALYHLAAQNPGSQWQGVYEELREEKDEKRLQQRAIAKLMDFADEQGKQILLIVENLNMLFDEQMSDGDDWDLRHTLQNEPRLMLLGTATQRFDEIDNVDKAWFEFFALYTMESLKIEQCSRLWESITSEELSDSQMRPMQILTGGNPRLLQILAGFAKGMSFRDLMVNLTKLIDSHTDYFKSLLEGLPATERRVFVELLEFWQPANTNQIAAATRMEVSKTSALLNRLLSRGAIELVEQLTKKKYYQASERLLNIYYLMRKRGDGSNRVNTAIYFMNVLYPDLKEQAKCIAWEAKDLSDELRKDHLIALITILNKASDNTSREEISQIIPDDINQLIRDSLIEAIKNLYCTKHTEILELVEFQISSSENICRQLVEQNAINLSFVKSAIEELDNSLAFFKIHNIFSCTTQGEESMTTKIDTAIEVIILTVMNSIIEIAAIGHTDEAIMILTNSTTLSKAESLIAGLRIFSGEKRPLVAQEIFEMGLDIADRIRSKQSDLVRSKET
jgi:DNA polymerase III delta prime subunit